MKSMRSHGINIHKLREYKVVNLFKSPIHTIIIGLKIKLLILKKCKNLKLNIWILFSLVSERL